MQPGGRALRRMSLIVVATVVGFGAAASTAVGAPAHGIAQLRVPSGELSEPWGLALSHNGRTLYAASASPASVLAIPTRDPGAATRVLSQGTDLVGVAVSPSGGHLFVCSSLGDIADFTVGADGRLSGSEDLSSGSYHFDGTFGLALNPSGAQLLIADYDNVLVADTATDTVTSVVADPDGDLDEPLADAFSPSGKTLYIGQLGGVAAATVSGSSADPAYTVTRRFEVDESPSDVNIGVAVSPNGKIVYTSDSGNPSVSVPNGTDVLAIDAATGEVVNTFTGFAGPIGLAITSNGQDLYVSNDSADTIDELSLVTLTARPKISGRARVGKTLKARATRTTAGTVKVKLSYQWLANGRRIKHATGARLKLEKTERGKQISVRVTGKAAGLITTTRTSRGTSKVRR